MANSAHADPQRALFWNRIQQVVLLLRLAIPSLRVLLILPPLEEEFENGRIWPLRLRFTIPLLIISGLGLFGALSQKAIYMAF